MTHIRTLISTTTLGQWRTGSNDNEGVLHTPQSPELEPHHRMQFSVIPRTPLKKQWKTNLPKLSVVKMKLSLSVSTEKQNKLWRMMKWWMLFLKLILTFTKLVRETSVKYWNSFWQLSYSILYNFNVTNKLEKILFASFFMMN